MTTENHPHNNPENNLQIDPVTNVKLVQDHEYDGIKELDNDLPSWWKWLFILTIVFALLYMIRLWVFRADDLIQGKELEKEMAAAKSVLDANKTNDVFEIKLLTDELAMASGKETWLKICSVCHLADGGGIVGPNMTDNYWIHGNKIENLYDIVANGVVEKGMIPYKDQLSPKQRLEVVSYILNNIVGKTPAIAKAPQGELIP